MKLRRFAYQVRGPAGSVHPGIAVRLGRLNLTLVWFNRRKHNLLLRNYAQCANPLNKRERALLERLVAKGEG
jgi:hypothetical protein